ncbi:MAG: hypothetical protein CMJ31_06020 [Phycisphaerae bacterium]|nr:hypothetical protein [Phycisphaerae bacterium]
MDDSPRRQVEIAGEDLASMGPIAVDVSNARGSTYIEVDDLLDEPVVKWRARWETHDKGDHAWRRNDPPVTVSAEVTSESDGGPRALRVSAAPVADAPIDTYVDLRIIMPRCDGVSVRNSDGPVELVGVGGAITVDNGFGNGQGGRIELRTSRGLVDPVALVTTEGRVTAVVTDRSRGQVALTSGEGNVMFTTNETTVTDVHVTTGEWRGVWNDGSNPFIARTGHGAVRVVIVDDPEMFTIPDPMLEAIGR